MSVRTVVKIDLVGSKHFVGAREGTNPNIRAVLLKKLLTISQSVFPQGETALPHGSFYKAEGDAVYFLLDKPSIALRASIEFMREWFSATLPDDGRCPDCRVILDRGSVEDLETSGHTEVVGAPFENISVVEKSLGEGRIYVSAEVVKHCDPTMAKFTIFRQFEPRPDHVITVYQAEFTDPRTIEDSSLLHALFVAHPKAQAARARVLELFLLEYLVEKKELVDFGAYDSWCIDRGYPSLPEVKVREIASQSPNVEILATGNGSVVRLTSVGEKLIRTAQTEYAYEKKRCIDAVTDAVTRAAHSSTFVSDIDIGDLLDEYLSAVFSEVRLMANYFRETFHLMEHQSRLLTKFDYILFRALPLDDHRYFDTWRSAFIDGLMKACSENNGYVAAVFHNVLATYYLNRSPSSAVYSADKLKERQLFIDTNVLYAMLVRASEQYQAVHYFVDRLRTLGLKLRVFPFTVSEYESSIMLVEREVNKKEISTFLLKWDPWLYKEFRANKAKYVNQIEVCRQIHSITKAGEVVSRRFDDIDLELAKHNVCLERDYVTLKEDEIRELWTELRGYMASNSWSPDRYYDFIYESTRSPAKMAHDTTCIANLAMLASEAGSDELGPKVMFITLDRHLARCRRRYNFILTTDQFVEFMLPYLFVSDVPLIDANTFPNKLLGAQLATLLTKQKPDIVGIVDAFFKSKDIGEKLTAEGSLGPIGTEYGKALSQSRFSQVLEDAKTIGNSEERVQAVEKVAKVLEQMEDEKTGAYFDATGAAVSKLQRVLLTERRENKRLRGKLRALKRHPPAE